MRSRHLRFVAALPAVRRPDEDKFWLPVTLAQVTRFIATGVAFDTVAGSDSIRGYPRCRDR